MKHKTCLDLVGETPEHRKVYRGVYRFFETYGLPLGDLLFQLWEKDSLPDWVALVEDMVKAGRPLDRSLEAVMAAVGDACYPTPIRDEVIARLSRMASP